MSVTDVWGSGDCDCDSGDIARWIPGDCCLSVSPSATEITIRARRTHAHAAVRSWAVPFAVAAVSGAMVPFCTAVMPLNAHPGARPMPGPVAGRDGAGHAGAGIAVGGAGASPASRLGRHRDRREVMPLN